MLSNEPGGNATRVRHPVGDAARPCPTGDGTDNQAPPAGYLKASEWIVSPRLEKIGKRVAFQYGLPGEGIPDLLQELRLAVFKAGADQLLNPTWVFHTASHKAADIRRQQRRRPEVAPGLKNDSWEGSYGGSDLPHLLRARAARLPAPLRRFYVLRYEEGFSQEEIAERLRLCRGSIRWMEKRCYRMMTVGCPPRKVQRLSSPTGPSFPIVSGRGTRRD